MRKTLSAILMILLLVGAAVAFAAYSMRSPAFPDELRGLLRDKLPPRVRPVQSPKQNRIDPWRARDDQMRRFYEKRNFQFVWSDASRPLPQASLLVEMLRRADEEGLDPADYSIDRIESMLKVSHDSSHLADLDILLTSTFFRFASDLSSGRVGPDEIDLEWHTKPPDLDFGVILEEAVTKERLPDLVAELAPPHPAYARLKSALARYEAEPDRARTIRFNMERWRWMPRDLGRRHVVVNIAGFDLQVMEQERAVLEMRIIAGRTFTPTPIFSDQITYIVLNPSWNVPEGIARKEILSAVRIDEDYLEKNHMRIFDGYGDEAAELKASDIDWDVIDEGKLPYAIRQDPGPDNPLGKIKFMLPNKFDIYLHDTPADHLFAQEERDFSHGCIRLEKPLELAEYLLRDGSEWTREKILAAIQSGEQKNVSLGQPVPVHILYWTAIPEDDGTVRFHEDIYGFDKALLKEIMRQSKPGGETGM